MHYKWTLHSITSEQVKYLWFAKLRIFCDFFSTEKTRKIRQILKMKKFVKFEFSIYETNALPLRQTTIAMLSSMSLSQSTAWVPCRMTPTDGHFVRGQHGERLSSGRIWTSRSLLGWHGGRFQRRSVSCPSEASIWRRSAAWSAGVSSSNLHATF